MRSRITAVLFALGTVLGYGSGVAHLARGHHRQCGHSCANFASKGDTFGDRHPDLRGERPAGPSPSP